MKPSRSNSGVSSADDASQSGWAAWLPGVALVVVTFFAYLPVWRAGFIWDDDSFLTNNALIKQAGGLYRFWFSTAAPDYFPLTSTSLWLEWRLWGMNPLGYHLVNVLLHALSAVLWWRVLARLKIPGAWLAAAIFALHPVNVESVAWITERKNTLTMFFYALTLLWYLKAEATGRRGWYWASVGGFLLALLSKTSVVPLPVVLLGLAWWQRGKIVRQDFLRSVPFFVLAVVMGLVTVWFQSQIAIGDEIVRNDGVTSRLAVAGSAIWFYLYKALLPVNLLFVYPRWRIDGVNALSYLPLILFLAVLLACWRYRERWGRGWLFGLGYFALLLAPVLGFVDIYFMKYSLVADHWQYFAMLAVAAAGAAGLQNGFCRWGDGVRRTASAAVLVTLGALTWQQSAEYADEETLWQATLARNPKCYLAHLNLGAILLDQAQADEPKPRPGNPLVEQAITHFKTALEIHPDDAVAHSNLGNALFVRGEVEAALAHVRRALEIQPQNARVHTALGNILFEKGLKADALRHIRAAVRLDPNFPEARYALGNALFQQGQFEEAILELKQALAARRGLAEVHNTLGQALQRQGQPAEASVHFQAALSSRPRHANAHNNLGTLLLQAGQANAAITHFQTALEIQPDFAEAHYNLGNALFQLGQTEAAITHLRRAQEIQPGNASAHNNLGGALLQSGRTDEAVVQFEMALKLRPTHAVTHNNLGRALLQKGNFDAAGVHFQQALELQPDFVQAADNLRQAAWKLATSPQPSVRNGVRAVELALQLERFAGTNHPAALGTLAAAYAEAARFSEAVTTAGEALRLAVAQTNLALAKDLEAHLALYRTGTPFHETARTNSAPTSDRR